jgi:hypothetical protein
VIYINEHEIRLDQQGGLLPWVDYDRVIWLAMDFIRRCPIEPRSGLPWYLAYSCFWTNPLRPTDWPDNPAGKFGMAVETLRRYFAYSGEYWTLDVMRSMLDRLISYHTPSHSSWPGVPYASAEPVFGVYFGARADGHYVTEPDKIAQAALGYLRFFKLTGEEKYMAQADHCAKVLAEKVSPGDEKHSPWPFRVDVRDGRAIEAYTSHVIPAITLFDQLIQLDASFSNQLAPARQLAWDWLFRYPMQNNIWKGYFEDIRLDPNNENREQYSPLETVRYLMSHPEMDPQWKTHARDLIDWVLKSFGGDPFYKAVPMHEQMYCFHVMGSHTARYASLCAMYAEKTGEKEFAERAFRSFNWATYMADENGWVRLGVDRPDYYNQCWFTDGYFDYVPHFLDAMAYMPETASSSQDHLLSSSSVIQSIKYAPYHIHYQTFDQQAEDLFRLTFEPRILTCGDKPLTRAEDCLQEEGWLFDPEQRLLRVRHRLTEVEIGI